MKRSTIYGLVMALLSLVVGNGMALGQVPTGPKVTYNVRMTSPAMPADFELVHLVQDFVPGAATPVHTHGGQGLALVLEGELTQRIEGQPDKALKAGDTFVETPGEYFAVVNTSNAPPRLSVAFLLPIGATLTTPQPPQPQLPPAGDTGAPSMTFPETGYSVSGAFFRYWKDNGGLTAFGYPIGAEQQINGMTVQPFERAIFELHPANEPPYTILLRRLGVEALADQGIDWQALPKADPSSAHFFPETGHAIAPQFWNYYRTHGLDLGDGGVSARESLALFGYPISEARMETNTSGDTVLTQWFERARMEYHPNNPEPYTVLLGRLGADLYNEPKQ